MAARCPICTQELEDTNAVRRHTLVAHGVAAGSTSGAWSTLPGPSGQPGWHPDPWNSSSQRYWDGEQWSGKTAPIGSAPEEAVVEHKRRWGRGAPAMAAAVPAAVPVAPTGAPPAWAPAPTGPPVGGLPPPTWQPPAPAPDPSGWNPPAPDPTAWRAAPPLAPPWPPPQAPDPNGWAPPTADWTAPTQPDANPWTAAPPQARPPDGVPAQAQPGWAPAAAVPEPDQAYVQATPDPTGWASAAGPDPTGWAPAAAPDPTGWDSPAPDGPPAWNAPPPDGTPAWNALPPDGTPAWNAPPPAGPAWNAPPPAAPSAWAAGSAPPGWVAPTAPAPPSAQSKRTLAIVVGGAIAVAVVLVAVLVLGSSSGHGVKHVTAASTSSKTTAPTTAAPVAKVALSEGVLSADDLGGAWTAKAGVAALGQAEVTQGPCGSPLWGHDVAGYRSSFQDGAGGFIHTGAVTSAVREAPSESVANSQAAFVTSSSYAPCLRDEMSLEIQLALKGTGVQLDAMAIDPLPLDIAVGEKQSYVISVAISDASGNQDVVSVDHVELFRSRYEATLDITTDASLGIDRNALIQSQTERLVERLAALPTQGTIVSRGV